MKTLRFAAVLATLVACHPRVVGVRPVAASADECELLLYLQPLSPDAERLSFAIESVAAVRSDGAVVPLERVRELVSGAEPKAQRLLARGRLAPGGYAGFELRIRDAALAGAGGAAALLVAPEPARVDAPFRAEGGKPAVAWVELAYERSLGGGVGFAPVLAGRAPPRPVLQRAGFVSSPALDRLVVFDKRERAVVGLVRTGRGPRGLALDERGARLYVALSGDDEVEAIDATTGDAIGRIRLSPGDAPRDLALSFDGRTLVTANAGSGTASFLDPSTLEEVGRVAVGAEPTAVLLDRAGRRGFVLNRRAGTVTVLDVANRAAVATIATEAEPVRAALDRAGARLYVAHAGSPFLSVISVPDLVPTGRAFVGFGASALAVDPRTDLVYVGREGDARLRILDPLTLVQVDELALPGAAGAIAIDDAENALVAALPGEGRVVLVDLTSKRVAASLDVGHGPDDVTVARERVR